MKKTIAVKETPAFDEAAAKAVVTPFRHEPTARTVGYIQPAAEGNAHLFGVNRAYVATEPASKVAKHLPPPPKPVQVTAPAAAPAASS